MNEKMVYTTCCVESDADSIHDMQDGAIGITLRTLRRHCDTAAWERTMGYAQNSRLGIPLVKDWHVGYFRSRYRGEPCYYIVHSAIEHIWTAEKKDG